MKTAGWLGAACGAVLVGGVHFTVGDPIVREAAWVVLVAGACASVLLGIRWHRPAARGPWLVLAVALGLLTLGNLLSFPQRTEPGLLLTVTQVLELVAFPLFGVAALAMVRRQTPWGDREGAVDGAIVMVALSTLLAGTVFATEASGDATALGVVLQIVAPLMLAGVTACALRLLFIGTRVPATRFVVASSACALVGHVLRTYSQSAGTYERGDWTDIFIWAAYTCVALGALHPSMTHLTTPSERGDGRITRGRLLLLGASLLTPPTTILLRGEAGVLPLMASLGVSGLVLWRLWRLVLDHQLVRDELRRQALHDPLTDLPNRTQVLQRLHRALEQSGGETVTAVLFLDLDGFKRVNDDYSHGVGDAALVAVVERLQDVRRADDLLGRLAGDEFVLVCERVRESDVEAIADRVISAFATPFHVGELEIRLGTSVGVAVHVGPGGDAERLLGESDAAMYVAKLRSGSRHERFHAALGERLVRRRTLERDIGHAVAAGQLRLVYAPIARLGGEDGGIRHETVGVEALLRWDHPELGEIPHGEITNVASATGFIGSVGWWMVAETCEQLARWRSAGAVRPSFRAFVSATSRQLTDRTFVDRIAACCSAAGVAAADLAIQVPEGVVLESESVRTLRGLRDRGFAIALDDFGVGAASLAHIRGLPLDLIKIAPTFVHDIAASPQDQAIVGAVVQIARHLGAAVVGEGVESREQRARLAQLGCDFVQGGYVGLPVAGDELAADRSPEAATAAGV
jgi:diguanylate cyclase